MSRYIYNMMIHLSQQGMPYLDLAMWSARVSQSKNLTPRPHNKLEKTSTVQSFVYSVKATSEVLIFYSYDEN